MPSEFWQYKVLELHENQRGIARSVQSEDLRGRLTHAGMPGDKLANVGGSVRGLLRPQGSHLCAKVALKAVIRQELTSKILRLGI